MTKIEQTLKKAEQVETLKLNREMRLTIRQALSDSNLIASPALEAKLYYEAYNTTVREILYALDKADLKIVKK